MSTIVDYASLQTAVGNWLHRTDLVALIPDFIGIAEGTLSSDLDTRAMQTRATLTANSGNAYITLPTDMLEMERLLLMTDPIGVLRYETPDQLTTDYSSASIVGKPTVFTVIGPQLQLAATPDTNYSLELTYSQRLPSLSASNTTNWLLTGFPNAYLWAALCAAQPFIINDERLPMFKNLYKEAIDAINSIDWFSGSSMRVRAR